MPEQTSAPASPQERAGLASLELRLKSFTFSFYMIMAVVVTLLPAYFKSLGFSKVEIGMIYSFGPFIGIAANLFWGVLSDRLQTIKKTLLIVLLGQLAAAIWLFQSEAYPIVFTAMIAFYFFNSPLSSLNDSQLLLVVKQSGKSYSSFRMWGSFGFAFAALLFGQLVFWQGQHMIGTLDIGSIVITVLLCLSLRDTRRGTYKIIGFKNSIRQIMTRSFVLFLLFVLLLSLASKTNDYFLSLHLQDLGASPTLIGAAWMISALSEVPMFYLLSRYGHKFRELPLLSIAAGAYALRFLLVGLLHDPIYVLLTQLLHSVTYGIFLVTAMRYMMALIPDEFRATGQAIFTVVWGGISGLVTGLFGGALFEFWGGLALYRFAAVSAAAAAVGFLALSVLQARKSNGL